MNTCDADPFRPNYFRVYTSDGGVICCSTQADAQRIACDLNELDAAREIIKRFVVLGNAKYPYADPVADH